MNCVLIAPPWPLFNRPSIQLACLSAFLTRHLPEIGCALFHPYLELYQKIGLRLYDAISESSWISEAFGGMLLEPGSEQSQIWLIKKALGRRSRGKLFNSSKEILKVRDCLKETLDGFLQRHDWSQYDLCGITVSLNQLTSGLYLAKEIKVLAPSIKVVIGGAGVPEEVGQELLSQFEFIDYIVSGEGERGLLKIAEGIKDGKPAQRGVIRGEIIEDLSELPIPDFTPYFAELATLRPSLRFSPVIPVEFSRGCFWGRCSFCNLNVQWKGYRRKSWQRLLKEVEFLSKRYKTLDFAFMDNALPPKEAKEFFDQVSLLGRDFNFFGELRASFSRKDAHLMKKAGLNTVQVGIEALSNSLLKRLRKGRTVMDNLASMRHLLEAGIELQGNLIMDFPGTSKEEVEETLGILKYAKYFRPLKPVSFWLGYGSPVFINPKSFKISCKRPHRYYSRIFPGRTFDVTMVYEYSGTLKQDRMLWKQVREHIQNWKKYWLDASKNGPPLSFRDGGDFVLIRQVMSQGQVLHHRLSLASRSIFLDTLEPIALEELIQRHSEISPEKILSFLKELQQKELIYCDGNKVLGLPVRIREKW